MHVKYMVVVAIRIVNLYATLPLRFIIPPVSWKMTLVLSLTIRKPQLIQSPFLIHQCPRVNDVIAQGRDEPILLENRLAW